VRNEEGFTNLAAVESVFQAYAYIHVYVCAVFIYMYIYIDIYIIRCTHICAMYVCKDLYTNYFMHQYAYSRWRRWSLRDTQKVFWASEQVLNYRKPRGVPRNLRAGMARMILF